MSDALGAIGALAGIGVGSPGAAPAFVEPAVLLQQRLAAMVGDELGALRLDRAAAASGASGAAAAAVAPVDGSGPLAGDALPVLGAAASALRASGGDEATLARHRGDRTRRADGCADERVGGREPGPDDGGSAGADEEADGDRPGPDVEAALSRALERLVAALDREPGRAVDAPELCLHAWAGARVGTHLARALGSIPCEGSVRAACADCDLALLVRLHGDVPDASGTGPARLWGYSAERCTVELTAEPDEALASVADVPGCPGIDAAPTWTIHVGSGPPTRAPSAWRVEGVARALDGVRLASVAPRLEPATERLRPASARPAGAP